MQPQQSVGGKLTAHCSAIRLTSRCVIARKVGPHPSSCGTADLAAVARHEPPLDMTASMNDQGG